MDKVKIGIIGCGNISGIYLKNCTQVFKNLEVCACADLDPKKALARAEEFGIKRSCTPKELLSDENIELVLNLTVPKTHAEVSIAALEAGKSVYVEKPIAVTREESANILKRAKEKGLFVGSAPDTFMGAGLQTCLKMIDHGWIGEPIAATAFMMGHGPESWHPAPAFYYQSGGGPLLDMGPYYLTALIALLGPIKRVTASVKKSFPERIASSEACQGLKIPVEVPTHLTGILDFAQGTVATMITSFDVWDTQLPRMEIYGSEGTLSLPDPNTYGGPVLLKTAKDTAWREVPLMYSYSENSRGIGVSDMAESIRTGKSHRANGDMAHHVLEIMHGFHEASMTGRHYIPESTCLRPEPCY